MGGNTLGLASLQGAYDAVPSGQMLLTTTGGAFNPDGAALAAGVSGTAGPDYMSITRGATNVLNTAFNATDNRATIYSGALNGMDISPDPALLPDRATITVQADRLLFLRQDRTILVSVPGGFFIWNSTITFNTGLVNPTISGFIGLLGRVEYQTNANPFGMGNALLCGITWAGMNGADLGPGFVFAGNNVFQADGGATLMPQARVYFDNARYEVANGGTMTGGAIGHVSFFAATVINTGVTLGLRRGLAVFDVSGTGALTTQVGVDILDLNFAATNIGIRSVMASASGDFINSVGATGASRFGGEVEIDGDLNHDGANVGLYAVAPVAQHSSTGQTAGFTAGVGTGVNDDSTFTGGTGATAYTIGDVVRALKLIGLMAA